jgi:hypothetical protein
MKNYLVQLLLAIDQLGNALLGGWADETISSRAYRDNSPGWRGLRWVLDHIKPGHCEQAYTAELLRIQEPPELR